MKLPLLLAASLLAFPLAGRAAAPTKPILFVTQVPIAREVNDRTVALSFQGIGSVFSNAQADTAHCGRGGALWIYYPGGANGTLVNLTQTATWAVPGGQPAAGTIAVRNPAVSWDGTKAVFSIVVGAPSSVSDATVFFWQLYEIGPLAQGGQPVITKVANQPANYNNVSPCYGSNGRIIFASDRPHNGAAHLWPPLEEYLDLPTVSGLWSLDPAANDLFLVQHSPSGSFNPIIDSFGRLIFIRWDHLVRDAEAVTDRTPDTVHGDTYAKTFNGTGIFSSEAANATFQYNVNPEFFPEPRNFDQSGRFGTNIKGQSFNQFTPWMINQDGTGEEIVNHAGRHELGPKIDTSFDNSNGPLGDTALTVLDPNIAPNIRTYFNNFFFVHEDPVLANAGTYYGIDAPDVGYHGAGQIVKINGAAGVNPEQMSVTYVTHTAAKPAVPGPPFAPLSAANAVHIYRNPLPLSTGQLVAVHTTAVFVDQDTGTSTATTQTIKSDYDFRVMSLQSAAGGMIPDFTLSGANGLTTNVSYFANGKTVTYSGKLWELDPVEVSPRNAPTPTVSVIDPVEAGVFVAKGVNVTLFQNDLRAKNEALVVSRNMTARDDIDKQQPYNLKVVWPTSTTQSIGNASKLYTIGWIQFLQADLLRGLNGSANSALPPLPGRRVIAMPLHDTIADNVVAPGAPPGALKISDDGSMAAIVPARRAVTWHLLDNDAAKTSVVKERYWITFQPGEIRTCANCHGLNDKDQAGLTRPMNVPLALGALLDSWSVKHPFEMWQAQKFGANAGTASIAGANVDKDGDGLSNLGEYAFNTDPNAAGTVPFTPFTEVDPSDAKPYLTIIFHRRKTPTDITYHIESCSDLATWKEGAGFTQEISATDDGNGLTETVKARALPSLQDTSQLYLHVRITKP